MNAQSNGKLSEVDAKLRQCSNLIERLRNECRALRSENQTLRHMNTAKDRKIEKIRDGFNQMKSCADQTALIFQDSGSTSTDAIEVLNNPNINVVAKKSFIISSNGENSSTLHLPSITFNGTSTVQQQNSKKINGNVGSMIKSSK